MIRLVNDEDARAVADIYNYYVINTAVTFEEEPLEPSDMLERFNDIHEADLPWLVIEHEDVVSGFAYASKWKGRCAYRHSVEVTVYLSHEAKGLGLGSRLYSELFKRLRVKNIHVALGGISLPNDASIALHEKFGMSKVAHFSEVGYKFGQWVDVAYWQAKLS